VKKTELLLTLKKEVLELRKQLETQQAARVSLTQYIRDTLRPSMEQMNQCFQAEISHMTEELGLEKERVNKLGTWIRTRLGVNLEEIDRLTDERLAEHLKSRWEVLLANETEQLKIQWSSEKEKLLARWDDSLRELEKKRVGDRILLANRWESDKMAWERRFESEREAWERQLSMERTVWSQQLSLIERRWEVERVVWQKEKELLLRKIYTLSTVSPESTTPSDAGANRTLQQMRADGIRKARNWLNKKGFDEHIEALFSMGFDTIESLQFLHTSDSQVRCLL